MTLLSNTAILRHLKMGSIVIEPFDPKALGNVSYDLTLGDEIARYKDPVGDDWFRVFNPSAQDPAELFRIEKAGPAPKGTVVPKNPDGSDTEQLGFVMTDGERVLARSREIAGGRDTWCACIYATVRCDVCLGRPHAAVTTQLHATSTAARIAWQSCGCAGFGDVGFLNPWIFEVTNLGPRALWLPVGSVVAQVSFSEVEPILDGTSYGQVGSYQHDAPDSAYDPVETLKTWTLKDGLPKKLKVRP